MFIVVDNLSYELHQFLNNILNVASDNSAWFVSYTTSQVHIIAI